MTTHTLHEFATYTYSVYVYEQGGQYRTASYEAVAINALSAQMDAEMEYTVLGWLDVLVHVKPAPDTAQSETEHD